MYKIVKNASEQLRGAINVCLAVFLYPRNNTHHILFRIFKYLPSEGQQSVGKSDKAMWWERCFQYILLIGPKSPGTQKSQTEANIGQGGEQALPTPVVHS